MRISIFIELKLAHSTLRAHWCISLVIEGLGFFAYGGDFVFVFLRFLEFEAQETIFRFLMPSCCAFSFYFTKTVIVVSQ